MQVRKKRPATPQKDSTGARTKAQPNCRPASTNGQDASRKGPSGKKLSRKPKLLKSCPDRIPRDLKRRCQWLAWRLKRVRDRRGEWRWAKVPFDPKSSRKASTTAPCTWATHVKAVRYYEEHCTDGIGFVFTAGDPYTGIDLDDCRDQRTGRLKPWARKIVKQLDSYTEVSPSGTGVKIIIRAKIPGDRHRTGRIEMYDSARFFTVTGRRVRGTPDSINRRQRQLNRLYKETFPKDEKDFAQVPVLAKLPPSAKLADDELIARAMRAKNARKFAHLWRGDTTSYRSPSEADLALCSILAFYTGPDPERIDRLFRQSGLYRDKWERKDYRERTIWSAIRSKTAFYGARNRRGNSR